MRHERTMLAIAPPSGNGTTLRTIVSVDEVPLRGPTVDAKPGDFLLAHDGMVAVVSRLDGEIVDFGPEGALDGLSGITPAIFDATSQPRASVVFIGESADSPGVLHIVRRGAYLPVRLHTFVTFRDRVLFVQSTVEPESVADSGMLIGVGERLWWGNTPSWVQGVGFVRRDAVTDFTAFVAKEGKQLSYASTVEGVRSQVRLGGQGLPGFYVTGRSSQVTVAEAADQSPRRTLLVAASERSVGDAAAQLFDPVSMQTIQPPKGLPDDARIEVADCPDKEKERERRPYARFAPHDPIVIPKEGCFEVRAWAPGRPASEWMELAKIAELALGPSGTLVVSVVEKGAPSVARIQVRGVGNASPDWGEDPEDGTALNVAHIPRGAFQAQVPPGKYRVIADRGFEYSAPDKLVDIIPGERTYVALELERTVDTKGWISADLHLHAEPSPDAPMSLADRILDIAAAGVEVGVNTDHNRVVDCAPIVKKLGLEKEVRSIVGDEVTTEEMAFGHFNVFPLLPGADPIVFRRTSPTEILTATRASQPYGKDTIIQVNHPRMGDIGYFDVIRFNREDISGFVRNTPWAPLDFDAIEVFNGDDSNSPSVVKSVMKDWYALLDSGRRVTATGNSDAHRLTFHEAGLPRNYVASATDDPGALDQRAFVDAVRKGRVVVSSGPFIRFHVDDTDIGGTVAPGEHKVTVTVDCPGWMDCSYVELLVSGKVVKRVEAPFAQNGHTAELVTSIDLKPSTWLIAMAGGSTAMDAVLFRRGIPPFAFTNPIYVSP